jgi:predicted unusual protein kinase regulating ubiquinone biosynthesis (AarF/ABC1/UbiB family)
MANISQVFAIEIKQFMKLLKEIDRQLFEMDNAITNEFYTKREIIKELRYISQLVSELRNLFTVITEQAIEYKPNNSLLFKYLNTINEYIKKLNLSVQIAEVAYERDPDYGINGVYKEIMNSIKYIQLIEKELNIAITNGIFI